LWQELIDEVGGQYLPPTDHEATRRSELAWLGVAQFMTGDRSTGKQTLHQLQRERLELQSKLLDLKEAGKTKDDGDVKAAKKELDNLQTAIARVASAAAVVREDAETLKKRIKQADLDKTMHARWLGRVGETKEAIDLARQTVKGGKGEVLPLATLVDLLWNGGKQDEAKEQFETLRSVAGHADLETPLLAKLTPVAEAVDAEQDWRTRPAPAKDLGDRPPLDSLGPFRWKPYRAESWQAVSPDGKVVSDAELPRQPRLVIFYLGFGCLHCVEQLHAFAPHAEAYREAGIDVIAISTESQDDLVTGIKTFDKELNMPLFADESHAAFKSFRCWDDFEDQPLHGTFLIDAEGQVRWQDISYEPFMDAEFLLEESQRLLKLKP
jgi:peroxiredoxin